MQGFSFGRSYWSWWALVFTYRKLVQVSFTFSNGGQKFPFIGKLFQVSFTFSIPCFMPPHRIALNLRYPSFYEVLVPVKHVGSFIQTAWLDVYSSHVALKFAYESTHFMCDLRPFFNPSASSTVEVYFI